MQDPQATDPRLAGTIVHPPRKLRALRLLAIGMLLPMAACSTLEGRAGNEVAGSTACPDLAGVNSSSASHAHPGGDGSRFLSWHLRVPLPLNDPFAERIVASSQGRRGERRELAGEWSYDGTHLKRRYLQENGRQFAGGSVRFATFPLVSVGRAELVVDDKIEGRPVTYRRVPEGTQP